MQLTLDRVHWGWCVFPLHNQSLTQTLADHRFLVTIIRGGDSWTLIIILWLNPENLPNTQHPSSGGTTESLRRRQTTSRPPRQSRWLIVISWWWKQQNGCHIVVKEMIRDGWTENQEIVLDVYMDVLDIRELCWNFDCNFGRVPIDFKH